MMTTPPGFERTWLTKLSMLVEQVAGDDIRDQVMEGSEGLTSESGRQAVVSWTRQAMERLDVLVGEQAAREIMTGCACQYPKDDLREVRQAYQATGDVDVAHQMLQDRFEVFLRQVLELDESLIDEIVRRGWGLAGIRQGNSIMATKIPKSGLLVEYMNESDPNIRRKYYCHCPRVRDALQDSETLPATYCYCGAGFYKGIWEEILLQSVQVELLESVLRGDEVCKVAIHLPPTRQAS
jgi:hypothetical protein